MTFISYAQNFEDVILNRIFSDIEKGFYVDIGAHHPEVDSVTKLFYERGWNGINIEPSSESFKLFETERVRDINLNVACGSANGLVEFYQFEDSGLSTIKNVIADQHAVSGRRYINKFVIIKVLDDILEEYEIGDIHFLKVDVEGAEKDVLSGIDLRRYNPWVVLVEATEPNKTQKNHEEWEFILKNAGYKFVYFDGLNRFYISNKYLNLDKFFQVPPNVFDDFILAKFDASLKNAHHWHLLAKNFNEQLDSSLKHAHHWYVHAKSLNEQLDASLTHAHHWYLQAKSLNEQLDASLNHAHSWYIRTKELEKQTIKGLMRRLFNFFFIK